MWEARVQFLLAHSIFNYPIALFLVILKIDNADRR